MTVPKLVWTQQTRRKRPFWSLTAPDGDKEYSIVPHYTTTGELQFTVYAGKPDQRGKQKLAQHVAQLERAKALADDSAFARRVLYLIADAGDDHGMTAAEVAAATGASIEEAKDMMRRLRDGGYVRNAIRSAARAQSPVRTIMEQLESIGVLYDSGERRHGKVAYLLRHGNSLSPETQAALRLYLQTEPRGA
jgi:hypothetical protein